MCDPLALLGLAVGGAQSVMQYQSESYAAKQQNQFYRENAQRANRSAQDEMFQTQQRMFQEQASGAEQKIDNMREARAAKATASAAAGEAGVSGLSVDALLAEFSQTEARNNDRIDQNTEWSMDQLQDEVRGIQSNAENRINGVQRAASPSFFNTGLKIADVGLESYSGYRRRNGKIA